MVSLYRLQRRTLMFDTPPPIPADFRIAAELAPAAGLLGSDQPALTAHAGLGAVSIDFYSGRAGIVSDPPLPPVAFCLLTKPHQISIETGRIVVSGRIQELGEIPDIIGLVEHRVLPLLNLAIL